MKKKLLQIIPLPLLLCCGCFASAEASAPLEDAENARAIVSKADSGAHRQTYPLNADRVRKNHARFEAEKKNAPSAWKTADLSYFTVDPMGAEPYLPDVLPVEAKAYAPLDVIAAKGEFEPASFLLYPAKRIGKLEIVPAELICKKSGAKLPASAIDVKMVKVWYKSGSAWYGMFVDPLRRRPIPELLLNDETLVYADPAKHENYLKMKSPDGSCMYEWASASVHTINWNFTEPMHAKIEDAASLAGVVLNPDELKQIMVTVHVPKDAKAGLYTGELKLKADGKPLAASIPLRVKVLPFELPAPATSYNYSKPFLVGFYGFRRCGVTEKRVKNCVEHNVTSFISFPKLDHLDLTKTEQEIAWAKQYGVNTDHLFSVGPGSGLTTANPPTFAQQAKLRVLKRQLDDTAAVSKKHFGHSNFYCYGVDEGDANVLRAEQNAWNMVHLAGAKVMASTYPRDEMMFNLDQMNLPEAPHPEFVREWVRKYHEANPKAIISWYSNPHCGPENPDFNRRFYGLYPYANGFDADMNYAMLNHNVKIWNEYGDTYESDRRNNSMLYPTCDGFIDTLEWEGVREGIDDIRYVTLARQLASKAANSGDPKLEILGRKTLSRFAYTDMFRSSAEAVRLEAIRHILRLQNAMKGAK